MLRVQELGLSAAIVEPSTMREAHAHAEIELNVLLSGRLEYLMGGRTVALESRRLGLFWAATPHRLVRVAPETRFFVATIPLPIFLAWRLPTGFSDRVFGGELAKGREDPALGAAVLRWHAELTGPTPGRRPAMLEIEAACARLAGERAPSPIPTDPGAVERMCRLLAERSAEPLSVAEIAAAARLHPHYAMRVFKAATGQTLGAYLARERLAHAQRLLIDTDLPVDGVGAAAGFGSPSQFYSVFRARTGETPRGFRLRARG